MQDLLFFQMLKSLEAEFEVDLYMRGIFCSEEMKRKLQADHGKCEAKCMAVAHDQDAEPSIKQENERTLQIIMPMYFMLTSKLCAPMLTFVEVKQADFTQA